MKKILITGGCGFIGTNFIRHLFNHYPDYSFINLDKLTYAGKREYLVDLEKDPRYIFKHGDIADMSVVQSVMKDIDHVVHMAAESHVDRSIADPSEFIRTNVLGTYNLLECAKRANIQKFVQVSTDEVYGSLGKDGYFTESTPLAPNSPYSASKASSDMLARAYFHTYGFPVTITRCSNNYGPYQDKEKLIPLMISYALADKKLPVYGQGLNVRDWLFVEDHCRAIDVVLHKGRPGEVYNIGGNNEWKNIDIVKLLLKKLNKPESLISYVTDRLGHDYRYAIDSAKIKNELNWHPQVSFEDGLCRTVEYFKEKWNKN